MSKIKFPVDALVSFHYYRSDEAMAALVSTGRLRLIGDSGAFSAWSQGAPIDLDEYAAWCHRWRPHLLWCASLDVIGDPEKTWRNWTTLRDRHGLATVPTLHAGTDPVWLDRYAAQGVDMVGLGGMAGTGQAPRAYRWALHMIRYARDKHPHIRFHLWGVTNRQFLDTLPVYSADSSGILGQAYRYAQLRLFDPRTGRHVTVRLAGRNVYKVATLLRRVYGVDPATIERSTPANRIILIQIAVIAIQLYAEWLQARHKVSPPASLIDARTGPAVHIVSAGAGGATDDLTVAVTGERIGSRVHAVGNQPGRALHDLEIVAGVGPHVHASERVQDLRAAATSGDPGPRLHIVDAISDHLRQAVDGPTKANPRTKGIDQ